MLFKTFELKGKQVERKIDQKYLGQKQKLAVRNFLMLSWVSEGNLMPLNGFQSLEIEEIEQNCLKTLQESATGAAFSTIPVFLGAF